MVIDSNVRVVPYRNVFKMFLKKFFIFLMSLKLFMTPSHEFKTFCQNVLFSLRKQLEMLESSLSGENPR